MSLLLSAVLTISGSSENLNDSGILDAGYSGISTLSELDSTLSTPLGELDGGLGGELDGGLGGLDGPVDGGYVRFADPIYSVCPLAPPSEVVDGGFFLPTLRAQRVSCMMAACDRALYDQRQTLHVDTPLGWVVGVTAAVVVGFGAGLLVSKYAPSMFP